MASARTDRSIAFLFPMRLQHTCKGYPHLHRQTQPRPSRCNLRLQRLLRPPRSPIVRLGLTGTMMTRATATSMCDPSARVIIRFTFPRWTPLEPGRPDSQALATHRQPASNFPFFPLGYRRNPFQSKRPKNLDHLSAAAALLVGHSF